MVEKPSAKSPGSAPKPGGTVGPLTLGVLAVIWAISVMVYGNYQNRPPFAEEANIAWHIAAGHGFRSPMDPSPAAPPSAWSAPLYPLVIAAAYRAFGTTSPSAVTALMLLQALFFGIIVVGTVRLGTLLFESPVPGLLAAAFFSIHPLFLFYVADFWDEFMSLAIFVALTACAAQMGAILATGGRVRMWAAGAFGAGLGILALTNTTYASGFPALLYLAFWRLRSAERWRSIAVACGACLLVISPWTIRNYHAFNRLILVRTGIGNHLWIGNAPMSDGWTEDDAALSLQPFLNQTERQSLLALGEPAYNDLDLKRFEADLIANPRRYLVSCLRRSMYMLVGKPTYQPDNYPLLINWEWRGVFWDNLILNALVAILGVGGMFAARRFHYPYGVLAILAASIALPFIATAANDRYSLPLRWLLVFYAGACVWLMFRKRPVQIPNGEAGRKRLGSWFCSIFP